MYKRQGVECVVADVRELTFDGEVLTTPDGLPVNAIWRRSVTNDVLEFWDDSQDLINACLLYTSTTCVDASALDP